MTAFDPRTFFTADNAPEAAKTLGWTLLEADPEAKTISIEFDGKTEFANPAGFVQGGFLTAMMDDAMGPAIVVGSKGKVYASTIDLHVHFLRPVKPGTIRVDAEVEQIGRSVAFAKASLYDGRGRLCAKASCSSMIVKNPFAAREEAV